MDNRPLTPRSEQTDTKTSDVDSYPQMGSKNDATTQSGIETDKNEAIIGADIELVTIESDGTDENLTVISNVKLPWSIYILFVLVGIGPSWMLLDACFLQIPYFQKTQSEAQLIMSHMSVSAAMVLVTAVPIYFIVTTVNGATNVPYSKLIYFLIIGNIILSFIGALFWDVECTMGNSRVSIIVMILVYFFALSGHLQTAALIPWISCSFDSRLIPALMTGSNFGSLIAAGIALVQQPGASEPLFTPSAYFGIMICITLVSLFVFIYIDCIYDKHNRSSSSSAERQLQRDTQLKNAVYQPNPPQFHFDWHNLDSCEGWKNLCFVVWLILKQTMAIPIWWREVIQYSYINIYIQFVTWMFIRATLPYASAHTTGDSGEGAEQYAIEFSYVALALGSGLAMIYPIFTFKYFIGAFTILTIVFIAIVADNSKHWLFNGGSAIMVCVVFGIRCIDGYVSPLIFRKVVRDYPSTSEAMNRWLAALEKFLTFFGVWLAYGLVQSGLVT